MSRLIEERKGETSVFKAGVFFFMREVGEDKKRQNYF
jgi:hypothetical protein